MNRVLVLRAGLVAGRVVRYLLDRPDCYVTVASRALHRAKDLVGSHPRGQAIAFDTTQEGARLAALVADAHLVVSLLPYIYHV